MALPHTKRIANARKSSDPAPIATGRRPFSAQAGDGPGGSASWKTKDLVAPAGSVARPRRVTP